MKVRVRGVADVVVGFRSGEGVEMKLISWNVRGLGGSGEEDGSV